MSNKECVVHGCDHYAGYLMWDDDEQTELPECDCHAHYLPEDQCEGANQ